MLKMKQSAAASGTLRVLAGLLGYPDAQLRRYLPEMRQILRHEDALSDARDRRASCRERVCT